MSLTWEEAELSNNIQAVVNLFQSLVWFIIYIYSFQFCCRDEYSPGLGDHVTSTSKISMSSYRSQQSSEPNEDHEMDRSSPSGVHLHKLSTDLDTQDEDDKLIRIITTLYPLAYVFRYIGDATQWYLTDNNIESKFDKYFMDRAMDAMFVIGLCLFYLSIILRFKNGVKFSDYIYIIKLSKPVLYICYGIFILIFIINSSYFIFRGMWKDNEDLINPKIHYHLFWILSVMNLILGGILIGGFCQKILMFI